MKRQVETKRRFGFQIKNAYRVFEFAYHRFFLLEKGEA